MFDNRAAAARRIAYGSLAVLVLMQLLSSALQQPPLLIWLARVLPLLVFLPGMLSDNLRSYIWLCLVCLLYFIALVERLFVDPSNPPAVLAMASLISLFVAAMLYVRWRARELRGAGGPSDSE